MENTKDVTIKRPKELSLRQMVDIETRNREILTEFISKHMKKGTDYGGIHIVKQCPNKYDCVIKTHFSKDSLFKAGAEKVASLLKLRPEIYMERDAWEMAGSPRGNFFFKCKLFSRQSGELISEGIGSCSVEEKMGNTNNAVKIGKKRAFVDAVLSAGALSDFFTQDLEDMYEEHSDPKKTPPAPLPHETQMTLQQQRQIMILLAKKGKTHDDLDAFIDKAFSKSLISELTASEAEVTVQRLGEMPDADVDVDIKEMQVEKTPDSPLPGTNLDEQDIDFINEELT